MNTDEFNLLAPYDKGQAVGDLIGGELFFNYFLEADGLYLWAICQPEDEQCLQKDLDGLQSSDKQWALWKVKEPRLDDTWRRKITLSKKGHHIRYFDTPGGGWRVIEVLVERGFTIQLQSLAHGWKIAAALEGETQSTSAPTMQEAACLMAVKLLGGPPSDP